MLAITERGVELTKLPPVYLLGAGGDLAKVEIPSSGVRLWRSLLQHHMILSGEHVVVLALPSAWSVVGLRAGVHVFAEESGGGARQRLGVPTAEQLAFIRIGETANIFTGENCVTFYFSEKSGVQVQRKRVSLVA